MRIGVGVATAFAADLARTFVERDGRGIQILNVETIFGGSRGGSDHVSQAGSVRRGNGIDGTSIGQGFKGGADREKAGVSLGHELFGDGESFVPGVITVFFDFELIFARVKVEGVVGGCRQFTVDIDFGAGRETIGRKEASPFDNARLAQAVAFGIANDQIGAKTDKEKGREEDEKTETGLSGTHGTYYTWLTTKLSKSRLAVCA